jgi:hypothetical protein
MEILFNILHCRGQLLPEYLDLVTLKNFAVACDKYGCTEAAEFVTKTWLKDLRPRHSGEGLTYVVVAYLLNDPGAFQRLTRYLVLNSCETFSDAELEGDIDKLLPLEVYGEFTHA